MGLTKEQLKERAEAKRIEEERVREAERLLWAESGMMALFERATNIGMTIRVESGNFMIEGYDKYNDRYRYRILQYPASIQEWNEIYDLGYFVDRVERDIEEARVLQELKLSALGKLTKEECDALGIKKSIF